MLERYVETYVNAGVGAERDKLLAHLAKMWSMPMKTLKPLG